MSESLSLEKVFGSLVISGKTHEDLCVVTDSAPCSIHDIGHSVFIVGGDEYHEGQRFLQILAVVLHPQWQRHLLKRLRPGYTLPDKASVVFLIYRPSGISLVLGPLLLQGGIREDGGHVRPPSAVLAGEPTGSAAVHQLM